MELHEQYAALLRHGMRMVGQLEYKVVAQRLSMPPQDVSEWVAYGDVTRAIPARFARDLIAMHAEREWVAVDGRAVVMSGAGVVARSVDCGHESFVGTDPIAAILAACEAGHGFGGGA